MPKAIEQIVRESIRKVIDRSITNSEIRRSFELHNAKVHFVPARYRVLGGILQSLNIKFGNFIEVLIRTIVDNDPKVRLHEYSGRRTALSFSARTDALIDRYITSRQLPNSADKCDDEFSELLDKILEYERQAGDKETINKDIDCLFHDKGGNFVYAELKYNDDHDTGKFVDINRKFLKTYAGLVNLLKIKTRAQLTPYIYYLNPTKRWGNIYCPSSTVLRGPQLFELYFSTKYADVDRFLRHIGEDSEILGLFDDLYQRVRNSSL